MNREQLEKYLCKTYAADMDHPWIKHPNYAVFRHSDNRKWFAVIMEVSKSKLDLAGDEMLSVVNFKCDPAFIGSLRMESGFFPAYHMNKDNWITVALDGTADDEKIKVLADMSYELTSTKKRRKQIGKSCGNHVNAVFRERECEKMSMWKCPKCGREFKKKEQSHYCGEKPKTIDEYILNQDEDKQEDLRHISRILQNALPEAEERISWSMPTYWKDHNILHFAASKKHIGFYPGPAAVVRFSEELQEYKTDKGTIRIPYGKIDAALIGKIAKWCMETGNHA